MMEVNDLLQTVRLFAHVVTMLLVAAYCPSCGSKKRPGLSYLAVAVAGGSAAMAVSLVLHWGYWRGFSVFCQLALTTLFLLPIAPLLRGRGNLAVLFPPRFLR